MMKKTNIYILLLLLLLLVNPFTFSWASEKIKIEKAKKIVREYIESGLDDASWKDNSPRIADDGTFYYTDDTNTPSYIEFQITCEREEYCGFAIINIDGNDVGVPIASTIGSGPAKVLVREGEEGNTKLYYFGPIAQYSVNEQTGEVFSIDPQDYATERKDAPENQRYLQEKFQKDLHASIEFKSSSEFREQVEELRKERQSIPKDEFASKMKVLDMSYADLPGDNSGGYSPPYAPNTFVPGNTWNGDCKGQTPCYEQHWELYEPTKICASGCAPVAAAIVYAYHDNHNFPGLILGTNEEAPFENTSTIKALVNTLRGQMETYCGSKLGGANGITVWTGRTFASKMQNAIKYAKDNGYPNSEVEYYAGNNINKINEAIIAEVNAGRPIILASLNHAFVGYGYSGYVTRMNMGWGKVDPITGTNGVVYKTSAIDYNIGSIFYNGTNQGAVKSFTKFKIQE